MYPYIAFITFVFSLLALSSMLKISLGIRNLLHYSTFVLCVLFLGLRYNVGVDYASYYTYMEKLVDGSVIFFKEPFFDISVILVNSLGLDLRYTFLLLGLFFLIPSFLSIKYWSKNYELGVLIFILLPTFYLASFNSVRQFIAVGFFMFSIRYIYERDLLKYVIVISLGALFHKSIILVAPVYLFVHKQLKPKILLFLVVGYILVMKFALASILSSLGFMDKLLEFDNEGANLKGLVFVILCIVSYIFKNAYRSKYNDFNIVFNLVFIASIISITPLIIPSLPSSTVLRMSSFFTPAIIFYLSAFPSLFKGTYVRVIIIVTILTMSLLYFLQVIIYSGDRLLLTPYQTFI